MEIVKGKRGRRKKFFPGVSDAAERAAQPSAFPSNETEATIPGEKINEDAAAKAKILEAAKQIPEIFTPEHVKWAFDAYVAVLCFAYSIALKTDFKALQDELEFSEEQKDAMAKPLARICSKYAPASWAGMSAEIELITMLGLFTVSSFGRARAVAIAQVEKKRDTERTQPVAPINRQRADVHVPA